MSYRKSLALNTDWDLAITTRDDALKTLTTTCDHRVNYQLVRTGLIANKLDRAIENPLWIKWDMFNQLSSPFQLLGSMISALLRSFRHVESVDISNGEYNIVGDTLEITGVCFKSDCDTSKTDCVNI